MGRMPDFKSDGEAAEFWDTYDFTDFEDKLKLANDVEFAKRPKTQTVSISMDRRLIEQLKALARYI